MPFAGGEHRRHQHRAGVHRAAFEGVVEVLAVRGGAVDEGGTGCAQSSRVADRGAWSVVVPAFQCGLDIIFVARGDAEADDVDQCCLALGANRVGQRTDRGDAVGEMLGDGNVGKLGVHRLNLVSLGLILRSVAKQRVSKDRGRPILRDARFAGSSG